MTSEQKFLQGAARNHAEKMALAREEQAWLKAYLKILRRLKQDEPIQH
jgi:hypothetical protein